MCILDGDQWYKRDNSKTLANSVHSKGIDALVGSHIAVLDELCGQFFHQLNANYGI